MQARSRWQPSLGVRTSHRRVRTKIRGAAELRLRYGTEASPTRTGVVGRWWCWYCSRDNNGEISRDNWRPAVLCEAAWAVAAPGGPRPCCSVTSWSGDTPLEVPRPQPSEWTGGPPAARMLASGGRLPRQLPLPSGVYFGSVLLRFSPGIAGSVQAGPRLEVTLLK